MLARILGVILLIGGVAWAVKLIWPVFGSLFGLLGAVAVGLLAAGALYIGLRWLRGEHLGPGRRSLGPARWSLAGILGRVELGGRRLWGCAFAAESCFDAGDALRGLAVAGQRRV